MGYIVSHEKDNSKPRRSTHGNRGVSYSLVHCPRTSIGIVDDANSTVNPVERIFTCCCGMRKIITTLAHFALLRCPV